MTIEERMEKMLSEVVDAHMRSALFGVDMANGRDVTGVTVLSPNKYTSTSDRPAFTVHSQWVIQPNPKEDPNVVDSTARVIE